MRICYFDHQRIFLARRVLDRDSRHHYHRSVRNLAIIVAIATILGGWIPIAVEIWGSATISQSRE
jgi:hypothetical protein